MAAYAHPETLVGSDWVAEHLNDPKVRVVEVDYDPAANYEMGHIPGSGLIDWRRDMNDPVARDIAGKSQLEEVLRRLGVKKGSTIVLHGDFNNWFAAFAFWVLDYYGASALKLMNGGRKKWVAEDRPLTKEVPPSGGGDVALKKPNEKFRAYLDDVRRAADRVRKGDEFLIDVRSPKEFTGEVTAPPEYPNEHAQRGGHIPGAKNVPWGQAVNEDGTFKSREELDELYRRHGLRPERPVITYCRIGERSSHSWFVLRYLLGYPNVRNYDGSWTEWGNQIRSPIEKP